MRGTRRNVETHYISGRWLRLVPDGNRSRTDQRSKLLLEPVPQVAGLPPCRQATGEGADERGRDRAAQHVSRTPAGLAGDRDLQEDPRARPQRPRPVEQRATGAEIHHRHRMPGAEDRLKRRYRRMAEAAMRATFCQRADHVRSPG
ncbi:MAG TPA: hypothetical protein VFO14_14995 [Vicinamibacterales bacterium]|nr:hypothetical protein [Vicinamibacterales bacterium]